MMMAIAEGDSAVIAMNRPQIGIDRLQIRKSVNEPKEAMNCKSCRKRKVSVLPPVYLQQHGHGLTPRRSSAIDSSRRARHVKCSIVLACTTQYLRSGDRRLMSWNLCLRESMDLRNVSSFQAAELERWVPQMSDLLSRHSLTCSVSFREAVREIRFLTNYSPQA